MSKHSFDPAQFTENARRGWDSVASGWKKWAPTIEAGAQVVNDRLVDMTELNTGDKALDIATGYGEPLVTVAERVGPTGNVVATDLSPEMIELAREHIVDRGLANVTFYVANGETLEVPEGDFDAALCRWGLMLMADPDACLRSVYELLKPGGCAAMAVFSEPAKTPMLSVAGATVRRELGMGLPEPDEPNIFRFADAAELVKRFSTAGFHGVTLRQVAGESVFESPEDYVRFIRDIARDIVRLLEDEPAERQESTWQAVADQAHTYQQSDGRIHLGFECHCVAGRKPNEIEGLN